MHSRFLLTLGVVLAAASAARLLGSRRPEARLTRSIVAAKSAGVDEVLIASAEALRAEVIEEGQWLSLVGDPAEVSVGHALGTARLVGMAESLNKARRVAEMEVAVGERYFEVEVHNLHSHDQGHMSYLLNRFRRHHRHRHLQRCSR